MKNTNKKIIILSPFFILILIYKNEATRTPTLDFGDQYTNQLYYTLKFKILFLYYTFYIFPHIILFSLNFYF